MVVARYASVSTRSSQSDIRASKTRVEGERRLLFDALDEFHVRRRERRRNGLPVGAQGVGRLDDCSFEPVALILTERGGQCLVADEHMVMVFAPTAGRGYRLPTSRQPSRGRDRSAIRFGESYVRLW